MSIEGDRKQKLLYNFNNINELFREVNDIIDKLFQNAKVEDERIWRLFSQDLSGYALGYVMVKTIDEVLGKEKVMDCIRDYRLFIDYYNQAVKEGNINLPLISKTQGINKPILYASII